MFGAELRVRRAKQQLRQLEKQVDTFAHAHGKYLAITHDETGQPMIGLTNMDQARMGRIAVKIGETVYNLRTALDYAVHELSRDPQTGMGERWSQFPVEGNPRWFNMRVTGRHPDTKEYNNKSHWLKGVPTTAIDVIKTLQPPKVGNCQWTKELQDLSNPDKHQFLSSLRTEGRIRQTHREIVAFDPNTQEGLANIYYEAEIDPIAFHDGRPVLDTLTRLYSEVEVSISLLKSCVKHA